MPFKLPNFVLSANFFRSGLNVTILLLANFLLTFSDSGVRAAEEPKFGYRGTVQALAGIAMTSMSLRSDGRYLFFTQGDSNFYVFDTNDMARLAAKEISGTALAVRLASDTSLLVLTTTGLYSYDVTYPFKLDSSSTIKEKTTASTTITDACIDSNGTGWYLESETDPVIRSIAAAGETQVAVFSAVLGSSANFTTTEARIHCAGTRHFISATNTASGTEGLHFGSVEDKSRIRLEDYRPTSSHSLDDQILSADGSRFVALFNRTSDPAASDDAVALVFNLGGALGAPNSEVNLGSGGRALTSFSEGSDIYIGAFVATDNAHGAQTDSSDRFLYAKQDNFTSTAPNDAFTHGEGSSDVSASNFNSTVFSTGDHYKYWMANNSSTGGSALTLLSKAASLQFLTYPGEPTLSGSAGLSFQITSDSNITYAIYFNENASDDGEASGLNPTAGIQIGSDGSLSAGSSSDSFSITATDLSITQQKVHSLIVIARRVEDGSGAQVARAGFRFEYDPPPGPVKNMRTRFGDQAVQLEFEAPSDNDLKGFYIFFSLERTDLESLDTTSSSQFIGQPGYVFQSPKLVEAEDFHGSFKLAPILNLQQVWFRVVVMDKAGNLSTDNPDAVGGTAYPTKSLSDALRGDTKSCSLNPLGEFDVISQIIWPIFGIYLLILLKARRKKIGPSTSRNRRGGD